MRASSLSSRHIYNSTYLSFSNMFLEGSFDAKCKHLNTVLFSKKTLKMNFDGVEYN